MCERQEAGGVKVVVSAGVFAIVSAARGRVVKTEDAGQSETERRGLCQYKGKTAKKQRLCTSQPMNARACWSNVSWLRDAEGQGLEAIFTAARLTKHFTPANSATKACSAMLCGCERRYQRYDDMTEIFGAATATEFASSDQGVAANC